MRGAAPGSLARCALALSAALCLSLSGCGAGDDSAPELDAGPQCKTVDEHLAPLHARIEAGGLTQIATILRDVLDPASLRAIVQLLLDVGQDLPAGTPERLTALMDNPQGKRLVPVVVALLEPLPGDPTATPPRPARVPEMESFSRIATTCLSGPLFGMATEVMRDPRLGPVLTQLLGAVDLAAELRQALTGSGYDGKQGFVLLIRNIAFSMAAPGFDPQPLVATLDALAGDQPGVVAALRDLLVLLTRDGQGKVLPARAAVISQAVGCFIAIDAEFILPAYWYDVLLSPEVISALGGGDPARAPLEVAPLLELLDLGAYATSALSGSEAARDALGQVLGLLLRPDLAVKGIPELVGVLQGDILPGAVAMLTALLDKPCLPPESR